MWKQFKDEQIVIGRIRRKANLNNITTLLKRPLTETKLNQNFENKPDYFVLSLKRLCLAKIELREATFT